MRTRTQTAGAHLEKEFEIWTDMKTWTRQSPNLRKAPQLARSSASARVRWSAIAISAGLLSHSLVSTWTWVRHFVDNAVWGS